MKYFDLHCDTPFEMNRKHQPFDRNTLYVSLDRAEAEFSAYAQLAAYCAPYKMTDEEAFAKYLTVYGEFVDDLKKYEDRVKICNNSSDFRRAVKNGKAAVFVTVEDARITAGKLSRLDTLYNNGCRFLTLVWGGVSCVGGAHDTDVGLTDYGRALCNRCFETGIVPDVSHSSERTVDDVVDIANRYGKPFIATHSNSYEVYCHSRNLRDRHFDEIVRLGGIVGISLCDIHIQPKEKGHPGIDGVISHIEHYLSRGGENAVAFGCDFDGCDMPDGISGIQDIHKIPERLAQLNYGDSLIEKICYGNAAAFIEKNL